MAETVSSPKRKLRKIKKVKLQASQQPMTFGMPTKVDYSQLSSSDSSFTQNENSIVYDNNGDAENIHFVTDDDLYRHTDNVKDLMQNKNVLMLMFIACMVGLLFGYMSSSPKSGSVSGRGLEGVVFNPDVPKGRSRCGLVSYPQPCVLYIMNPKTQDVSGKDFYATAAKWTGREPYMIEVNNMHYGSQRIKPGNIAAINIPAL